AGPQRTVDLAPHRSAGRGAPQDRAVLSSQAKEIQEAALRLQAMPDFRPEKVAELRGRIDSGAYQIKSDRVATRMIKESLIDVLL
ncbi:MAG: flagellar biosynthesis anti-sigma factor FlgM, partial [Desulfobacterales bacterium]